MPELSLATAIGHARLAHDRLLETVEGMAEDDVHGPSHLPGWTRAHVLTHLARNADSHRELLEAARRGEVGDQYPHGMEGRAADIEAGAARPASDITEDVRVAGWWLEDAWAEVPPDDPSWEAGCRIGSGAVVPAHELVLRRWREIEVHHVDLDAGFGPEDWSAPYVLYELPRQVAQLGKRAKGIPGLRLVASDLGRSWKGGDITAPGAVIVEYPARRLLAWLLGRYSEPALPDLGPWG